MQGKPRGIGAAEGSRKTTHILFRARKPRGSGTVRSRREFALHGSVPAFPAIRGGKLLVTVRHPKNPGAFCQVTKYGEFSCCLPLRQSPGAFPATLGNILASYLPQTVQLHGQPGSNIIILANENNCHFQLSTAVYAVTVSVCQ